MSIVTTREQRRQLERDNAKWPKHLEPVPRSMWPESMHLDDNLLAVFRSRTFLVMKFAAEKPAIVRLSVNRTTLSGDRWADNITWDELQAIKLELGYFSEDAVEVYPPATDVVNVANMRHLWILTEPLPFAWRRSR